MFPGKVQDWNTQTQPQVPNSSSSDQNSQTLAGVKRRLHFKIQIWLEYPSLQFDVKESSLFHKSQFSNTYISKTRWLKPLIFQTLIVWSIRIHSLKYLGSTTLGSKHKGIEKISVYGKNSIPFPYFNNKGYQRNM